VLRLQSTPVHKQINTQDTWTIQRLQAFFTDFFATARYSQRRMGECLWTRNWNVRPCSIITFQKPTGNCMYHLLQHSVTVHFVHSVPYGCHQCSKWAGICRWPYRNLFCFLNYIPTHINTRYIHLSFFFFFSSDGIYPCFPSKKYTGTSKFPFRELVLRLNSYYFL
jgi:hypothetical protein